MSRSGRASGHFARRFVAWTLRHGRLLWVLAIVLAVPAFYRTALLYKHLRSELEELLPRDTASVVALDELRARFASVSHLAVVVDTGRPDDLEAGERFLDDLAARVRAYPPALVRSVRMGDAEERRFIEGHAPLYVDLEDLRSARERIEARRDYEVARTLGTEIEDAPAPPLDFADLERKYSALGGARARSPTARFSDRALARTLLVIEAGDGGESGTRSDLVHRVRGEVEALRPTTYAPGMRVGYAGDIATSVEETSALMSDLSVASVLVVAAVVLALFAFYRWWKSVVVLVPPLLLATVYSFALASLPPFGITRLNSNTAFLGSIIVGNGINFGILLLARYVEERRSGRCLHRALWTAMRGSRRGTLSAALAAGVSYAALSLTRFEGFRQFGVIGGIGMVTSWAVAFVLMPPLIAWVDRGPTIPLFARSLGVMPLIARAVQRARVPIAVAAALLTLGAGWTASRFGASHLETDFSKLRRADTWKSGEGYWGARMNELLGEYLSPVVVLAHDGLQAREIANSLRAPEVAPELAGTIAQVRTLDDFVPANQEAKLAEIAALRDGLTARVRSLIPSAPRAEIDRLLGPEDLVSFNASALPAALTAALTERDGRMDRSVLVYPRVTAELWHDSKLQGFVGALRNVVAAHTSEQRPARVAGALPLSADIVASVRHDGPLVTLAAFVGVVAVVLLVLGRRASTLCVLGSLTLGVLWLLASTMLLGVKINFGNFIAFPITFGIGVDYAVNVMTRKDGDAKRDIVAAVRSTGAAVGLCSVTTVIGYASLLLAENRGLYLFGLIAVLGEVACLVSAVVVMPAVVLLLERRRARVSS